VADDISDSNGGLEVNIQFREINPNIFILMIIEAISKNVSKQNLGTNSAYWWNSLELILMNSGRFKMERGYSEMGFG